MDNEDTNAKQAYYTGLLLDGKSGREILSVPSVASDYAHYVSQNTLDRLLTLVDISGKRVADVGTGPGNSANQILDNGAREVIGIDTSETMIAIASERFSGDERARFELKDANSIEDVISEADVVFACKVFKYLDDPERSLRAVYNALAQNGKFLFNVPLLTTDFQTPYTQLHGALSGAIQTAIPEERISPLGTGLIAKYSEDELRQLAAGIGFKVDALETEDIVLYRKELQVKFQEAIESLKPEIEKRYPNKSEFILDLTRTALTTYETRDRTNAGKMAYVCLEK